MRAVARHAIHGNRKQVDHTLLTSKPERHLGSRCAPVYRLVVIRLAILRRDAGRVGNDILFARDIHHHFGVAHDASEIVPVPVEIVIERPRVIHRKGIGTQQRRRPAGSRTHNVIVPVVYLVRIGKPVNRLVSVIHKAECCAKVARNLVFSRLLRIERYIVFATVVYRTRHDAIFKRPVRNTAQLERRRVGTEQYFVIANRCPRSRNRIH